MEKEKHVFTEEEKKEIIEAKKGELGDTDLDQVSGGWLWQDTVAGKSWNSSEEVRYCFSIGERVCILTLFGDGDWGYIEDMKPSEYQGKWVDMYYVRYDDGDAGWNGRPNFLWLSSYDN